MEYNLGIALRNAYLTLHRKTNAALRKFNVTADQFVCLAVLAEYDGITQKELSDRVSSDPNTIRAILLLLEKQRLIKRTQRDDDKRAFSVSLTSAGTKKLQALLHDLLPVKSSMQSLFNASEAKNLYMYLDRISQQL